MDQKPAGWILVEEGEPVGCGPSQHAAIADGRKRTNWPENCRQRLEAATAEELTAAAESLGPGGLTAAESAWCSGTQKTTPTYRRPVDAAGHVLAAAERLGGKQEGLEMLFEDGSRIELCPLAAHVGGGQLVRLPPAEKTEGRLEEPRPAEHTRRTTATNDARPVS